MNRVADSVVLEVVDVRFEWKAASLRDFHARTGTDLTDALIRKVGTSRCPDHPDFAIRLHAEKGDPWIDACCNRAAPATVAKAEFEVEALMRWFTPN
jgi:hypothetical protein